MGRILFVDDEPLALDALRRMFRRWSGQWELLFADNASDGLDRMAQQPVDVVVADLLMPGMKGLQFLAEVQRRFPATVRLILSGYADRDVLLECAGAAHQVLAKPCQPEVLTGVLERALSTVTALSNPSLRRVICQTDQLPTHPSVRRDLIAKLGEPNVSADEVSSSVARDIGLAGAVLKLANSPCLHLAKPICGISEAVSCVGTDVIRSLLGESESVSYPDQFWQDPCFEKLWRHSVDTALGAQTIARVERGEQSLLDEAFAAGLLHDAGKFLLVSTFGERYNSAVQLAMGEQIELNEAERHVFGVSHAEVGAALLGLWGLPEPMLQTVSLHHSPNRCCCRTFSALTAVHVANALVHECEPAASDAPISHCDPDHLGELGLTTRLGAWRGALRGTLSMPILP